MGGLAYDDVGDPAGLPVVYFHGSPAGRLARHPDDGVAAAAGVRLVAVDRPGIGGSPPDPGATVGSVADDVVAVVDHLGIERFGVLAWSAGAVFAVGTAARRPERVTAAVVACGLPPVDAYDVPAVRADTGEARLAFLDTVDELGPAEAAELVGPLLVPFPLDLSTAREHLAGRDPVTAGEIASVPGAEDRLAEALVATVAHGLAGVTKDLELSASVPDVDFTAIQCPVRLWYGTADPLAPPSMGRWWADQLADAGVDVDLNVVDGAGHGLALTRWAELLTFLSVSPARPPRGRRSG